MKQSAAIIALLVGASSAVQLRYKPPTPENRPRIDIQSVSGRDRNDQIGTAVHDAVMEATPDPTPSRRDVLGGHPKSFEPSFGAGGLSSEDRNAAEAAEKAAAIAA